MQNTNVNCPECCIMEGPRLQWFGRSVHCLNIHVCFRTIENQLRILLHLQVVFLLNYAE